MNKEQIEKLHAEAQREMLGGAKAKNMDLQDIIALCQAAEHSLSAQDEVLTDEQEWAIITEICGTQLTRVGNHKFQVVETGDMATAGELARALAAAAPSPAVAVPLANDPNLISILIDASDEGNTYGKTEYMGWCKRAADALIAATATPSPSLAVRDVVGEVSDTSGLPG